MNDLQRMEKTHMIRLRSFTAHDALIIQQKQYPDMPAEDIRKMIAEWETNSYQGKLFEMYAITAGNTVVGSISLYEHTKNVASIGIDIYPDERRKGYASEAMRLMADRARTLGYRIIQDQVRADNQPSIALHQNQGFETDGYVYQNTKGESVFLYLLCL